MAMRVLFYIDGLGRPLSSRDTWAETSGNLENEPWGYVNEEGSKQRKQQIPSPVVGVYLGVPGQYGGQDIGRRLSEGRDGRWGERENKGPETVVPRRPLMSVGSFSEMQNHQTFPSQRNNVTRSGCCGEHSYVNSVPIY